ncbi:MAG: ATP-dependent protease ATPase subunit HslU [Clostridia bacterium]|nr:ATP-dependent protease ATPase subunit HslU [Clostridia bacterium]
MEFTPKQIIEQLDRYIIGQGNAKRAVAIALRNRYRRSRLTPELREEITPKNIIMQGPTGVGKTEIARRLAKLVKAPFVKVEATKFTEVGYVGRDVESMIRDLVEVSVRLVKEEKFKEVERKAGDEVDKILLKHITPLRKSVYPDMSAEQLHDKVYEEYKSGALDDMVIEIDMPELPKPQQLMPGSGIEINMGELLGGMLPQRKKRRKITVKKAYDQLLDVESEKLIDNDSVNAEAIARAENEGIIFIDEIDKIASRANTGGADVSREGVQRDILPIVEGSTINTKYGSIKTDFILFIAAGAFHISSVSDLIPELQGRFPILVKLDSLSKDDFVSILTQTDNAILKQYTELLRVDNVELSFTKEAIEQVALIAAAENENKEDIGARRLHTIMETLLDDISFNAGSLTEKVDVKVDKNYVENHLSATLKSQNLKKYIL